MDTMNAAMRTDQLACQIHDCLLAGAMGDALGAGIEFATLAEIQTEFPQGFTDLPVHQGIRGAITDDTQMTLFTAEGMVRAFVRGALKGIRHAPGMRCFDG